MNKKQQKQFNVIFRAEAEGGFTTLVPSLPGCVSYGKTLEQAKKMILDAINGYVASLEKHKEPIPSDENNFFALLQMPAKNSPLYA